LNHRIAFHAHWFLQHPCVSGQTTFSTDGDPLAFLKFAVTVKASKNSVNATLAK
jgi:hypothetical protein